MNIETNLPEPQQDIFAQEDIFQHEYASSGQRFVNWLVDNLFMRFALSWASGYVVGYILNTFFPEFTVRMILYKGIEYYSVVYMVGILNYLVYYTFCEKVFKGYTLGKLISGTRAIREDGNELTFKNAILRTLSRMVPFEPFSIWGDGLWHDRWTKTMVVQTR
jgi:uncharacterized RDD family membrane protein YckC